ncbi:hypothetical protein V6M85_07905 [Sulfolobus tengchongensis]|uniref:HhH-GPD domain-containing protein n=1 Tax=Sulfolobus tengchongensis TaxID=207809 RepID=A0AAX4KX86_9CREN
MKFTIEIEPIPPFNLVYTAWLLKRSSKNLLEHIEGNSYIRSLTIDATPVLVKVTQINLSRGSSINIELHADSEYEAEKVVKTIEKMVGMYVDLYRFYNISTNNNQLKFLVNKFIGAKPVVFPTIFETLVNAITCQQVSLESCLTILSRLVVKLGEKIKENDKIFYSFPDPIKLSKSSEEELRSIGYSRPKIRYIKQIATKFSDNELSEEKLNTLSDDDIISVFSKLKGIGKWSLDYILLRGYGKLNVFPTGDVGAQNKIRKFFNLSYTPNDKQIDEMLKPWSNYKGLVYFYLLLASLEEKGILKTKNPTSLSL